MASTNTQRAVLQPCPVARYNERLHRARSSNNLAVKLPEASSPAPRSAGKERPMREGKRRTSLTKEQKDNKEKDDKPEPEEEVPSFRKNPFLLADKKKQAPSAAPPPPPPPTRDETEPRPIGTLTDEQITRLQSKRKSLSLPAVEAPPELPAEVEATEEVQDSMRGDDVEDSMRGDDVDDSMRAEEGVQVMPMETLEQAAATQPTHDDVPKATCGAPTADTHAVAQPAGDLGLVPAAQHDIAVAMAAMLPALELELAKARAVEATAEPLADVVRRARAGKRPRTRR